jgi:protein TonB
MSDVESEAWAQKRARRRSDRRARAERRVAKPVAAVKDPLWKPRRTFGARVLRGLLIVAAALFAHGAVLGSFFGANAVLGGKRTEDRGNEPIQVTMVEPPPPEPEPEPEVEAAPEPRPKPKPKPKPRPKRRRRPKPRKTPPPPDPTDAPAEAEPPPKKKKARRIVGLNMSSTAKGGSGPAFAVGNTRMGRTAERAENPDDAQPLPKGRAPRRKNRRATRLPIGAGGPKLTKPKYAGPRLEPEYPDDYRAQNLEAKITLEVTIGADGRVKKARVVKGSPYEKFEAAALATARRQRWVPAQRGGEPVRYTITYAYFFKLKD